MSENSILEVKLAGASDHPIFAVSITNPEDFGGMDPVATLPTPSALYRNIFLRRTSDNTVWYLDSAGTGWEMIDTTTSEVLSVNGHTGAVVLAYGDVGADAAGAAAGAVAAHLLVVDPHPQYLTPAEGSGLYDASGSAGIVAGALSSHAGLSSSVHGFDGSGNAPAQAHLVDGAKHTAAGLTTGHFFKATGATTFGFGAHGLTYSDVGADASGAAAGAVSAHASLTVSVHGYDASGNLGIGTTTPATALQVATALTSSPRGIMSSQHSDGTDSARFHGRKSRGTSGAPTAIVSGDMLSKWVASGYDGTSYLEMAAMSQESEGTIATGRVPTRLLFSTATDASPSVLTERMRIDSSGRVGIGMTPTSLLSLKGTATTDQPTFSAEFLLATGWTSTGWTGDWAGGWTHTIGNTTVLSQSKAAVSSTYYQVTYTITGRTAGTISIGFGGTTANPLSASGNYGRRATSTASLTITPTTDFDGTVVISIKSITGVSTPIELLQDSSGVARLEIRASSSAGNILCGVDSGAYITTGLYDVAYGPGCLQRCLSGRGNSAFGNNCLQVLVDGSFNDATGYVALGNIISGTYNCAYGYSSLSANTASGNCAYGASTLQSPASGTYNCAFGMGAFKSLTSGSYGIAIGGSAAYYQADGVTILATTNNSVYIGYGVRGYNDSDSNSIVIGYTAIGIGANTAVLGNDSILFTALKGNVGIGATAAGTSAVKALVHATGTAPASSPADAYQMYSADQTAGNACPHIRTEAGQIVKIYQAAHIADPSGGATVDTEARAAIVSILAALEAFGRLATS